jgi:hypothetical protein
MVARLNIDGLRESRFFFSNSSELLNCLFSPQKKQIYAQI